MRILFIIMLAQVPNFCLDFCFLLLFFPDLLKPLLQIYFSVVEPIKIRIHFSIFIPYYSFSFSRQFFLIVNFQVF